MNKTPNYQLNQWGAEDRVLRTDFNADNAKIDAAIKAVDGLARSKADASALAALQQVTNQKVRVALGSYTGDGAASRAINVGFLPKVMFIRCLDDWQTIDILGSVGIHHSKYRYQSTNNDYFTLSVTASRVTLSCRYSWSDSEKAELICNSSGKNYTYAAFG